MVAADLRVGASPAAAVPLKANEGIAYWGVKFYGDGFIVTPEEATKISEKQGGLNLARYFVSGRDLTGRARRLMVIDCDGLDEAEVRLRFPATYQHLLDRVKPVRDHNPRALKRERWWIFGENQPGMRRSVADLKRYIATTETARHRVFEFFERSILAEGTVAVIALEDAFFFGVLSSRVHVTWALAAGGRLGVGNDPRYNKTRCFDPFPFPDSINQQKVRELGEALDAHRKRQRAQHPALTITEMYNVLEKLRRGEPLTDRERATHEQGLVSVLRQLHEDLDAAVFEAYGWPSTLSDEEVLERLVRLNAERAAEERAGTIRWLRPEFQRPAAGVAAAFGEEFKAAAPAASKQERQPWPKSIPEQARAVRQALASQRGVVTPRQLAAAFTRANVARIEELLRTLVSLGQAREVSAGRYAP
jgi:hypothetical protein